MENRFVIARCFSLLENAILLIWRYLRGSLSQIRNFFSRAAGISRWSNGFNRVADDCDKARWLGEQGEQGGQNATVGKVGETCRTRFSHFIITRDRTVRGAAGTRVGRTITYARRFRLRRSDTAVRRIGVADKLPFDSAFYRKGVRTRIHKQAPPRSFAQRCERIIAWL